MTKTALKHSSQRAIQTKTENLQKMTEKVTMEIRELEAKKETIENEIPILMTMKDQYQN